MDLSALRFQYNKKSENPYNWETMPFYLKYLRAFLRKHSGHSIWLKGQSGGEQAAYLIFNSNLRERIVKLLTNPLAELGDFSVTGEKNPVDILKKFYRGKIGIGYLDVEKLKLGIDIEKYGSIVKLPNPIRNGNWIWRFKEATQKTVDDEEWVCLHEIDITSVTNPRYHDWRGKIWIRLSDIEQCLREMKEEAKPELLHEEVKPIVA